MSATRLSGNRLRGVDRFASHAEDCTCRKCSCEGLREIVSVWVDRDTKTRLAAAARACGMSASEVMRTALELYLEGVAS